MGSAIINGILNQHALEPDSLYVSRKHPEKSTELAQKGVHIMQDNVSLAESVDCILLAVKPVYAAGVLREIHDMLVGKFVISIVAGWTFDMLKDALPETARFVRVMPNTPLAVGEGMSLISSLCTCTDEEFAFTERIFAAAGKVAVVEDHVYTPANGISGCGPAFVYAFIEAMADGGVRYGVPRALAYELAAQTLVGAARMVLETGEHPGKLKDAVCSPGGTTIEGMYALEKGGMRAAVMDAVGATVEKTCACLRSKSIWDLKLYLSDEVFVKEIIMYTDGACSGNPGPGGWGTVLMFGEHKKEISGFMPDTTNNRMELFAAVQGFTALKQPCAVTLYSDSAYLVNAFKQNWIDGWQRNGWKTASKKPVENQDLWKWLLTVMQPHKVTIIKVKGHADNPWNNRCDELATGQIRDHRNNA